MNECEKVGAIAVDIKYSCYFSQSIDERAIYFLSTAEDTKSTYDDGEVLGSFIGRIDLKSMKIDFTQKITSTNKFEGLTFYKKDNNKIEFLLCEDNDTELLETKIYKLSLPVK